MKNKTDTRNIGKRIWGAIRAFCTKNLVIKVVALLFAVLLWGYVLTDLNPNRTKIVGNVQTSFSGEAELMAQGLCVRGDRSEILSTVSAQVRTQIANYSALGANQITASISLRNISEARVYELPISASLPSGMGVVESVSPSVVTVEIDDLLKKTIPVLPVVTGELPDGYWADMDNRTVTQYIEVEGPKTDLQEIRRAECIIDLDGRTGPIFSTYDIIMYDADNQVIDSDILIGTMPSATVRIPIYPVKNVPIDVVGSLEGADNLAPNHELFNATCNRESVRLVGERAVLDEIDILKLEPINISGGDEMILGKSKIIMPEGTRMIDESGVLERDNTVSVTVDIRESVSERLFEQLPIEIEGLGEGLAASLDIQTVDLKIKGRVSLVDLIKRSDIRVQVDLTNLTPGEYTLDLFPMVRDEESTVELETFLLNGSESIRSVRVVIKKAM